MLCIQMLSTTFSMEARSACLIEACSYQALTIWTVPRKLVSYVRILLVCCLQSSTPELTQIYIVYSSQVRFHRDVDRATPSLRPRSSSFIKGYVLGHSQTHLARPHHSHLISDKYFDPYNAAPKTRHDTNHALQCRRCGIQIRSKCRKAELRRDCSTG